jgi:glycosyltransferase involved in cell wall biosynthesis
MTPRLNVHVYQTTFKFESRMLKVIGSLERVGAFDEFLVFALWEPGLAAEEKFSERGTVCRIRNRFFRSRSGAINKVLCFAEFMWRVYWRLRKTSVACVNAHSLQVLPVAVAIKRKKKCHFVYEPHELETGTDGCTGIVRRVSRWIEGTCIRHADAVICVSDSIAEHYRADYGLTEVTVVRNVPVRKPVQSLDRGKLRREVGLSEDDIIYLYQGILGPNRNIELLLEVFRDPPPGRHLVLLGFGPLSDLVKEQAVRYPNIHFVPGVPPHQLLSYSSGADVGIFVLEDNCLNYHCCLPNKIWEFLTVGVPVLMTDIPELRRVIEHHTCGWVIEPKLEEVRRAIRELERSDIERCRRQIARNPHEFGWHIEERSLLPVYESLLGRCLLPRAEEPEPTIVH